MVGRLGRHLLRAGTRRWRFRATSTFLLDKISYVRVLRAELVQTQILDVILQIIYAIIRLGNAFLRLLSLNVRLLFPLDNIVSLATYIFKLTRPFVRRILRAL